MKTALWILCFSMSLSAAPKAAFRGCQVLYEGPDSYERGPRRPFGNLSELRFTDGELQFRAWRGNKKHSFIMTISRGGRQLASFTGTVSSGEDQILQYQNVWLTCSIR